MWYVVTSTNTPTLSPHLGFSWMCFLWGINPVAWIRSGRWRGTHRGGKDTSKNQQYTQLKHYLYWTALGELIDYIALSVTAHPPQSDFLLQVFMQKALFNSSYYNSHTQVKLQGTHQKVNRLNDIQEHLVFPVLYPFWSPWNSICNSGRRAWSSSFKFVAFLSDVPSQPQNWHWKKRKLIFSIIRTHQNICLPMEKGSKHSKGFVTVSDAEWYLLL